MGSRKTLLRGFFPLEGVPFDDSEKVPDHDKMIWTKSQIVLRWSKLPKPSKQVKNFEDKIKRQSSFTFKTNIFLLLGDDPDKIPYHVEVVRTIYPKK